MVNIAVPPGRAGHDAQMGDIIRIHPERQPPHEPLEPLWREALGRRLRETRRRRGARLVDVAARAGLSPQYLSEIERGRKEPSSEMIAAVCGALNIELGRLLGGISADLTRPAAPNTGGTVLMAA
ncbi:helix-turn-helix domain-containing protein [Mycobacterium sp. AMU20-3851]|uniref:helix-turn-helix domain-containing protein n=1 Tax=Mycobacterium sp. AMU20-3851 TaxID=3122055 RepID=UPI00375538DB